MDTKLLHNFIDIAISLELNISKLYNAFGNQLKKDHKFWFTLEVEEKNHAALLKTAKDFIAVNRFPNSILPESFEAMLESNRQIEDAIRKFTGNPDRELAFKLAFEIEKSAGEAHYQLFMDSESEDYLITIFKKLNRADKDHTARILKYWQDVVLNGGL